MSVLFSTNLRSPDVDLRAALLTGQAPDKGLYMPRELPTIPRDEIVGFRDKPYSDIAFAVLRRFTTGLVPDDVLHDICRESYDYDVPLEPVRDRLYVLRLDRGPTASFKDFAARAMARLMRYFLKAQGGELVILTATSGDTGSAVAAAFHNVENIRVVVLFPRTEVTARQRKQMTTLGGNVTVVAIDGKFDDCQALVKQAFADPELAAIPFSSANSINIGRLLPQSVYYFYAWARLQQDGERALFCVPSGNFGDMCGGMLALKMGLPAKRLLIATNANDEFPRFLAQGEYHKVEPSRVCISSAMNVGHPSNLPRLVALYGGVMDERGNVSQPPDFAAMRRDLWSTSVSDEETRAAITSTWKNYRVMLEPHGAVGWAALERFLSHSTTGPLVPARDMTELWGHDPLRSSEPGSCPPAPNSDRVPSPPSPLTISLETAHPAKFPEEIQRLLGIEPELPPALAGLDAKTETYESAANDYDWFREFLRKRFS